MSNIRQMVKNTPAYLAVQVFYFGKSAARSGEPYMKHIDQGIEILIRYAELKGLLDRESDRFMVQRALDTFCLHPLYQSDADLAQNAYVVPDGVGATEILLAMEYRNQANAWLSDKVVDDSTYSYSDDKPRLVVERYDVIGKPSPGPMVEVKLALVADKVQNYHDFLRHHEKTHKRSKALSIYFQRWFTALEIDDQIFQKLTDGLN